MASGGEHEAAHWQAQAERWQAEAKRLARKNKALEAKVAALIEKVATLAKLVFGDSSEKKKPDASAPESAEGAEGDGEHGGSAKRRRGQQPGSAGHGRRDYSGLETKEEFHDVPEGDRVCPECGGAYVFFDEETSEQIDWRVQIVRIVHRRKTYSRTCSCAVPGILAAPLPAKPIPKGRFTASFLARLVVEKYVLGRPLERIVAALAHDGFDVAKGTLVGALHAVCELLGPLDEAIRARNAEAGHLHVDETSWSVFEEVAGKANHRWWLWVFLGPDTAVFLIDPTRSTKVVEDHLGIDVSTGSLAAGRHLLVSSDFFTVYQSLAKIDGLDPLWCWAHIRRYFIRASDAHKKLKPWTAAWMERIGALYAAHRALDAADAGSAAHEEAMADFTLALKEIDTVRKKEAADEGLHPRAQKVLATLDHEWEGLARHAEFPELALDNNAAERALRNPVVCRKNCYGSGARWAATLAGRVWTITATASKFGANPLSYLTSYLDACGAAGGRAPEGEALEAFFPWAASNADLATWRMAPAGPSP